VENDSDTWDKFQIELRTKGEPVSTFFLIISILALLSLFTGIGAGLFTGFFGAGVSMGFWTILLVILILWKLVIRSTGGEIEGEKDKEIQ
jgi:hypothetical protein